MSRVVGQDGGGRRWRRATAGPEQPGIRAHPVVSASGEPPYSVRKDVFVIRHRVHIVTRFVGVWTPHAQWARSGRRVVPGAEVPQDLLRNLRVINHRNDAHGVLAHRAAQRVHVPDPEDEIAPPLGGQLQRRWRERPGRRTTNSDGRPRWRRPRILLLYQP